MASPSAYPSNIPTSIGGVPVDASCAAADGTEFSRGAAAAAVPVGVLGQSQQAPRQMWAPSGEYPHQAQPHPTGVSSVHQPIIQSPPVAPSNFQFDSTFPNSQQHVAPPNTGAVNATGNSNAAVASGQTNAVQSSGHHQQHRVIGGHYPKQHQRGPQQQMPHQYRSPAHIAATGSSTGSGALPPSSAVPMNLQQPPYPVPPSYAQPDSVVDRNVQQPDAYNRNITAVQPGSGASSTTQPGSQAEANGMHSSFSAPGGSKERGMSSITSTPSNSTAGLAMGGQDEGQPTLYGRPPAIGAGKDIYVGHQPGSHGGTAEASAEVPTGTGGYCPQPPHAGQQHEQQHGVQYAVNVPGRAGSRPGSHIQSGGTGAVLSQSGSGTELPVMHGTYQHSAIPYSTSDSASGRLAHIQQNTAEKLMHTVLPMAHNPLGRQQRPQQQDGSSNNMVPQGHVGGHHPQQHGASVMYHNPTHGNHHHTVAPPPGAGRGHLQGGQVIGPPSASGGGPSHRVRGKEPRGLSTGRKGDARGGGGGGGRTRKGTNQAVDQPPHSGPVDGQLSGAAPPAGCVAMYGGRGRTNYDTGASGGMVDHGIKHDGTLTDGAAMGVSVCEHRSRMIQFGSVQSEDIDRIMVQGDPFEKERSATVQAQPPVGVAAGGSGMHYHPGQQQPQRGQQSVLPQPVADDSVHKSKTVTGGSTTGTAVGASVVDADKDTAGPTLGTASGPGVRYDTQATNAGKGKRTSTQQQPIRVEATMSQTPTLASGAGTVGPAVAPVKATFFETVSNAKNAARNTSAPIRPTAVNTAPTKQHQLPHTSTGGSSTTRAEESEFTKVGSGRVGRGNNRKAGVSSNREFAPDSAGSNGSSSSNNVMAAGGSHGHGSRRRSDKNQHASENNNNLTGTSRRQAGYRSSTDSSGGNESHRGHRRAAGDGAVMSTAVGGDAVDSTSNSSQQHRPAVVQGGGARTPGAIDDPARAGPSLTSLSAETSMTYAAVMQRSCPPVATTASISAVQDVGSSTSGSSFSKTRSQGVAPAAAVHEADRSARHAVRDETTIIPTSYSAMTKKLAPSRVQDAQRTAPRAPIAAAAVPADGPKTSVTNSSGGAVIRPQPHTTITSSKGPSQRSAVSADSVASTTPSTTAELVRMDASSVPVKHGASTASTEVTDAPQGADSSAVTAVVDAPLKQRKRSTHTESQHQQNIIASPALYASTGTDPHAPPPPSSARPGVQQQPFSTVTNDASLTATTSLTGAHLPTTTISSTISSTHVPSATPHNQLLLEQQPDRLKTATIPMIPTAVDRHEPSIQHLRESVPQEATSTSSMLQVQQPVVTDVAPTTSTVEFVSVPDVEQRVVPASTPTTTTTIILLLYYSTSNSRIGTVVVVEYCATITIVLL
eukprot:Lankesteria_metandrocarpae@DN1992_c0_g1_i1.p1